MHMQNSPEFSLPAAADLSARQYHFINLAGGQVALAAAGARSVGILQNEPKAGELARYHTWPIMKLKLGGNVAVNADVTSGANGVGVTAAAGNIVHAVALDAGVAGDIIRVQWMPGRIVPA